MDWSGTDSDMAGAVIHLMDRDAKTTGLKQLQGMIWADGFHSGQLVAHVYEEVPECLRAWKQAGRDLRIYSSGSVTAQKLFFGHSIAGDLLPLFTEHYDTAVGGKREASSYLKITESFGMPASEILFVSDIVEELDAAASAGLQCVLSKRPENAPIADSHGFPEIHSFREIELVD
jgi:enolase-phosphatase E1